jgi:DNA-binding transcriptional LysR family regulator
MLVVCAPEHRLADGRRHRPSELAGDRWVAFSSSRTPKESFVQFLERKLVAAGLESVDIIPIDGLTAQKRLVEAGFGIALLAQSGVEEELRTGTLKVIDIPALEANIPVVVVHRRNGYLSAAAQSLLAMIAGVGGKTPGRDSIQEAVSARQGRRQTKVKGIG